LAGSVPVSVTAWNGPAVPRMSVVIPHWPLDDEVDAALRRCVRSFPFDCERIVVVNDGTGYGRNVNVGLRLATGDFVAVVNNDCVLIEGDVHDLCVDGVVTSPLVIGERQGFGESIEPGGFHGSFWVIGRAVLERVGLLDERFERAYWEDDDLLARLRAAGVPTRQVASVCVRHVGGLSTVKVPEHRRWLELNAQRFEEKWGSLPAPKPRYRRARGEADWHFCQNCPRWPASDFDEVPPAGDYGVGRLPRPPGGCECDECAALRANCGCAFY
jgi:GT2 family glycosyltransferase